MDIQTSQICVKQENRLICHCCLSVDRILTPLCDEIDIFMYLSGHQDTVFDLENIYVCWECSAILRKIRSFQDQIQIAQSYLQNYFYRKIHPQKCFTNLCQVSIDNTIFMIHEEDSEKLPAKPKRDENRKLNQDNSKELLNLKLPDPNTIDEKDLKEEWSDNDNEPLYNDNSDTKEFELDVKFKREGFDPIQRRFRHVAVVTKINEDISSKTLFEDRIMKVEDIEKLGVAIDKKKKGNRFPKCKSCRKMFYSALDYQRHQTFCHLLKESEGPFKCLQCDEECPTTTDLKDHWAVHNTTTYCKLCGDMAHQLFQRRKHAEKHHHSYTCKLCPAKPFHVYKYFLRHLQHMHKKVVCDYCNRIYKTSKNYLKGEQGIYQLKKLLREHIATKHEPLYCKICDKYYAKYRSYYHHCNMNHPELIKKDKHATKELSYCVECNKNYGTHAKYMRHLASSLKHTEKRTFKCPDPECGKEFSRKLYMNNHYKLFHKKQTKHHCNICGKYLVSAYSMRKHMMGVHMKVREPKTKICELCGRAFSTNGVLRRHMRTHTGERPYKCAYCSAAFTQRTPLVSHCRTQHKLIITNR